MPINREHASKGYKVVTGTSRVEFAFYGFTVISEATLTSIEAPTVVGAENTAYDGDEAGLAGDALPVGYYPIRGSAVTPASGKLILWKE